MPASIENVAVKLRGDANQYDRTLTLATQNTAKFANQTTLATVNASKFTTALSSLGSIAAGLGIGVGVTAIIGSLQRLIDQGDRLDKLSSQLGASATDLDKLRQVAELSGSDLETAARGVFRLALAIEAAERSPKGGVAQAFGALNIDLAEFRRLDPVQQLEAFAKGMRSIEDPTKRAEVAAAVLGNRIAKELIPTLNALADDALKNVVEVMDNDFSAAAARFNDNLAIIESSVDRIKVRLATTFAEALAKTFVEFGIGVDDAARRVEILERRLQGLRAPGFINQNFGRPLAEALLGKTADEIELELLDLRSAIDELGDAGATSRALRNFPGGDTSTDGTKKPTAAETDLQRRLEGLNRLEQEFLDAESVRVFEAERLTGVQAQSLDLSRDQVRETERLREAWLRVGEAGSAVLGRLVGGTLRWQDALQLVVQEALNALRILAQANATGSAQGGAGTAGTIFGLLGSAIGGGGFGGFGSAAGFENFFNFGSPIIGAAAATPTGGAPLAGVGIGGTAGFTFTKLAEGGITRRAIIGEAGPEAIIPLDRMSDVMRDVKPNNSIGDRIQPNSERPIIIEVSHNGTIVEPSQFKPTPDEQWDVFVDGVNHVARVRDAIGSEVSRRTGR